MHFTVKPPEATTQNVKATWSPTKDSFPNFRGRGRSLEVPSAVIDLQTFGIFSLEKRSRMTGGIRLYLK